MVITGIGIVTAIGNSPHAFWRCLVNGCSGAKPVTRFDPSPFCCRLAAEVVLEDLPKWQGRFGHEIKRMDPFVQYALAASRDALKASELPFEEARLQQGGIFIGVAMGGLATLESGVILLETRGPLKTSPYLIPSLIPNMAAGMIALDLQINVPQYTLVGGCASGTLALGQAMDWIRSGRATWALAGGSDAVITPITFAGFQAMHVLSPATEMNSSPRPFDRSRDGMIVGEGAAVLVLEDEDYALARGAPIYVELLGYASSTETREAFVQSSDETAHCLELVLEDARLDKSEVDCIYAHAGGLDSDGSEMTAIDMTFSRQSFQPAVTSIKGHIGYTFGAAGPLDIVAAVMALREQRISPVLNFEATAAEFAHLDIVKEPRGGSLRNCLIYSYGLGGVHAAIVVSEHRQAALL